MPTKSLTKEEQVVLTKIARQTLELGTQGMELPILNILSLPPPLQENGACFVTLTKRGALRGCIGTLEAYRPLAEDVREHTLDAALHDYRFPSVTPAEVAHIRIEISRLTPPLPLQYEDAQDLLNRLRPGIDGVILKDGFSKATFLPQVWEKLPDTVTFLDNLCEKMGAEPNVWRHKPLHIATYQVEEFHE